MDRLLTDEAVRAEFRRWNFDMFADDETLEKVGNVIAITRKAQDRETLKAAGKFLEKRVTYSTLDKVIIEFAPSEWDSFKRGEMPEVDDEVSNG